MTVRELSLEEIAEIGGAYGAKGDPSTRRRSKVQRHPVAATSSETKLSQCNHDWQPDKSIFAKGEEYKTKRCMTCHIRIICKPDEVIDEVNIGEWLAG